MTSFSSIRLASNHHSQTLTMSTAGLSGGVSQKRMRKVSPPGASIPFNRFIYILLLVTGALIAFYAYRITQWKNEVGGWWGVAPFGKRPPAAQGYANVQNDGNDKKRRSNPKSEESVEDRINALAEALGMPSKELASAIAGAVKSYVPPASLSSIAEKETGKPAVEELLREKTEEEIAAEQAEAAKESEGMLSKVASNMESFVGMDEP
jgi:hypothetical protein